ncbi:SH2 domain protein [Teladorsagia circumcincta]|uniref:Tyrosine-protein kinase n=1 Tax=Teladorsagia circumcincta TaxID=45464 RepID=A0A2G9UVB6_TELCI|nr:SH2 domain protein [Teladorsagia circumcincta]
MAQNEVEVDPLKKAEEEKEEEKILKELKFYHGYLPREDLLFVLKNEGDYLLRVSEVGSGDKTVEPDMMNKRAIILSVLVEVPPAEVASPLASPTQPGKIKNVIIRKLSSKYYVEIAKPFDSLKELLEYYQTNTAQLNKAKFTLKNPIAQQRWEFHHSDVQLGKLIGEGAYGEVREGTIKKREQTLEVAVKLAKGTGELSKAKIKEMMREARLIRNFKHRNIVRLYGVAVDEQPLYILLELVKGGALNVYLRGNGDKVSVLEKITMCKGAAQGVEYLHKQSCIHMDLAARNCLYSQDKVVKISDFGLSRLGVNYTIRGPRKLPIKWLAPETISTFTFSLKTDVFTYGVMVYEIFTNGNEPWDGYSNAEVKKGLVEGKTLTLPDSCPEEFRNFIKERVYTKDPSARATMSEVVTFIKQRVAIEQSMMVTLDKKSDNEKSVFERLVTDSPPKAKPEAKPTGSSDDANAKEAGAEAQEKIVSKAWMRVDWVKNWRPRKRLDTGLNHEIPIATVGQ